MGGAVLYLLLISQSALTAELPQLHQFLHLLLSVKLPVVWCRISMFSKDPVAFTSLSHVPRVHTVLFFNPRREGSSASQSEGDSKEWKKEGGFYPKVTSKRRITIVQHTAKPSAPEALDKLPLSLLKPT